MEKKYISSKKLWAYSLFVEFFGMLDLLYIITGEGLKGLLAWPMIMVPIIMIVCFALTLILTHFTKIRDNYASILSVFCILVMALSLNMKSFSNLNGGNLITLIVIIVCAILSFLYVRHTDKL